MNEKNEEVVKNEEVNARPQWEVVRESKADEARDMIFTHGRNLRLIYLMNDKIIYPKGVQPRKWQIVKDRKIENALKNYKENEEATKMIVVEDEAFYAETYAPLQGIDEAFGILTRLEGRTLDIDEVAEFREKYKDVVNAIEACKSLGVDLLKKANVSNIKNNQLRKEVVKKKK